MTKYTYILGRKCLHCGDVIPDQKHLALKFCDYKELGKSSKESCKNKYWSKKKTKDLKAYRMLVKFHKSMNNRITQLLLTKGENVTIADINKYGIVLKGSAITDYGINKKGLFYFVGYQLEEITNTDYKIKPHELLL